jgi:hypothetical protein
MGGRGWEVVWARCAVFTPPRAGAGGEGILGVGPRYVSFTVKSPAATATAVTVIVGVVCVVAVVTAAVLIDVVIDAVVCSVI